MVTSSADSVLRLWDVDKTDNSIAIFYGHKDIVTCGIVFNHNKIISSSWDQTMNIYDIDYEYIAN